jgi:hypothetical protein
VFAQGQRGSSLVSGSIYGAVPPGETQGPQRHAHTSPVID